MFATGLYGTRNLSNIMFAPRITWLEVRGQWNQIRMWKWWLMPLLKNNVIYSTIICDDDSIIRAVSIWSYKELSNLQSDFQSPRTINGEKNPTKDAFQSWPKTRQKMHSTTHSRTKVSVRSIAQDPHSSPPCFSEIQWPSLCRETFQSRLSPTQDILWSMD